MSAHWFEPSSPGFGYSVQVHPFYEFIGAFLYDARGEPRFLAAERGGAFDADGPPLPLYQLQGAAPTAPYAAPTRTVVGSLSRVYATHDLATVATDAEFAAPVAGSWLHAGDVDPLSDTRQPCSR